MDTESRSVHRILSEKLIPWSKTPFDDAPARGEPQPSEKALELDEEEEVEEEEEEYTPEEVPQWLELFFDLAWTITFSGLTGGTPIKDGNTIASYAVFFALAWWLWVSQVLYDTKYYTNDWWHRIMLVLQFVAFGILASFTDGFDIFNGITHDAASDAADLQVVDAYVSRAFKAISLVFGVTRILLAIQYIRVAWYIKRQRGRSILGLTIASLIVSGVLFFISFFLQIAYPRGGAGHRVQVAKFVLWAMALLVEIGAYLYSPSPRGLRRKGSMSERLATLTTVVLGEGLNGMIEPLVSIAKSDAFGTESAIQIMSTGLLILMAFILYFSTFDTRTPISTRLQKFIIFVHFPTQLLLTLLLEGMKSLLGYLTINHTFVALISLLKTPPAENDLATLNELRPRFAHFGVDFDNVLQRVGSIQPTPPEQSSDRIRAAASFVRLIASVFPVVLKQFNLLTDDLKDTLDNYAFGTIPSPGPAVEDAVRIMSGEKSEFILDGILNGILFERLSPISYLAGVAGGFLLCLLLLLFLRGNKHVDRYFAWSIVIRLAIGVGIILLNLVRGFTLLSLPVLLALYVVQYLVDYIIHVFMAREVKRARGTAPPPLPPKYSA